MFKVIWDKPNNGVILTMSSAGEALSVAPRPVFHEELDLLGLDKMGWIYPRTEAPLLWACNRRYFYRGMLVMEVKGGNLFDDPIVKLSPDGSITLSPINIEALREKNNDAMFLIEHEAMEFINGAYRRYKGITKASQNNPDIDFQTLAARIEKKTGQKQVVVKEDCDSFDIMPEDEANAQGKSSILTNKIDIFVVSFSGGKDSQVVLDLVSRVVPSTDFSVIYSDTGYELPSSLELYDTTANFYVEKYPEIKFHIARNRQPLMYYWDNLGSPSRIQRWCCSVMKSAPLARTIKELSGMNKQPQIILFDGVRAEESANRAGRPRVGKNVKHNNMINLSPLLNWNSTEIYLYILFHHLPFNPAYRKGFSRVGCIICPFSSEWSEDLCSKLYPEAMKPFVSWLETSLNNNNVEGVRNYIKTGKWKMRAGGRDLKNITSVNFVSVSPVFSATLQAPRENILTWLKVLGKYSFLAEGESITGKLKYVKRILTFSITPSEGHQQYFKISDTSDDLILISQLKKILYKSAYCVHCEVCEVECPTGALSVTPIVTIDENSCVHCLKCLSFNEKGCITASSASTSYGNDPSINKTSNMKSGKSGINRYNDGMGLRDVWLQRYFDSHENFFTGAEHGLNIVYQIPPFTNWLKEACIIQEGNKQISETGKALMERYKTDPSLVWEIIFINLCYNSEICNWFQGSLGFDRLYSRAELDAILQDSYPNLKGRTLSNPLNSLINTFKESPLGKDKLIVALIREKGKLSVRRQSHNALSLVAAAYSLFKYAESRDTKSLTVSEFYAESQTEGIYRQFGIERVTLERILRTLQEERNHVLNVQLNLGLDNINLREDLSSADILKIMP